MKQVFHREPNPLKRWAERQFFTVLIWGREVEIVRLRWWPLIAGIICAVVIGLVLVAESIGRDTPV